MNIVLLMEKYCDLNPALGETSAHSNLLGSLLSANISVNFLNYDLYLITNHKPIDNYLIDLFKDNPYDALVVSYYPFDDPRNVALSTFDTIRAMGVPVIFVWFDYGHQQIKKLVSKVADHASLNVILDVFEEPDHRFLSMWVPQDERLFTWSDNKDIDVSFVGSTAHYREREHYLNLINKHITVYRSGGQREYRLTIEQYADILKRSKISLNFPRKPDGIVQAKSRIYETMLCGAMLMECENEAIKRWFEPNVDYIPFTGDVVDKIRHYLSHENERLIIAKNGYNKMKNQYNSINWWGKVFERA